MFSKLLARQTALQMLVLAVAALVIVGGVVAELSARYPAYGPICEVGKQGDPCSTYSLPTYLGLMAARLLDAMSPALTALATLLVGLFTITLARSTNKMWKASTAQLKHSEATSERQLRAYVGVERIYFQDFVPEKPINVVIEVKNYGLTPAYNYHTNIYLALGSAGGSDDHAERVNDSSVRGQTLMPNNNSIVICELPLGNVEMSNLLMNSIRAAKLALYVVGRVDYRDSFGQERYTKVKKIGTGDRINTRSPFINPESGNDSN